MEIVLRTFADSSVGCKEVSAAKRISELIEEAILDDGVSFRFYGLSEHHWDGLEAHAQPSDPSDQHP
ncbi:hypothetical protein JUM41_25715 [Rhizobium pusense]|uniref:hypothetical protein n=1 Tax=Agrobacterium pusense TaxID=648995 RepID=UPI001FCD5D8B|nr:hypothetical protein [Agrobacterium pusense]MCJ2877642.1 hypothetical protein [Agrobacterium pusense]